MDWLHFIGLIVTGVIAITFGHMIYVEFGGWLGRTIGIKDPEWAHRAGVIIIALSMFRLIAFFQ